MDRRSKTALVLGTALVSACGVAWDTVGEAQAGSGQEFRYHYVSLNANLPQEFIDSGAGSNPFKVTNTQVVYGSSYNCSDPNDANSCYYGLIEWRDGNVRVLKRSAFYPRTANDLGIFGGGMYDFNTGAEQAALLVGGRLKILDRLPGESTSYVSQITNTGIALVESFSEAGGITPYLYWLGRTIPLKLAPNLTPGSNGIPPLFSVNEYGVVTGSGVPGDGPVDFNFFRAFRFVPPRGPLTILMPADHDTISEGEEINHRGEVLGYSVPAAGGPRGRRIGVWCTRTFQTYYIFGDVPGNPGFPEYSLWLLWNEPGLIVNVAVSFYGAKTFIMPRPGMRVDLNEAVDNEPRTLRLITDLNNVGDMVGYWYDSLQEGFVLKRVMSHDNRSDRVASTTSAPEDASARHATRAPSAIERRLHDRMVDLVARAEAARRARVLTVLGTIND